MKVAIRAGGAPFLAWWVLLVPQGGRRNPYTLYRMDLVHGPLTSKWGRAPGVTQGRNRAFTYVFFSYKE